MRVMFREGGSVRPRKTSLSQSRWSELGRMGGAVAGSGGGEEEDSGHMMASKRVIGVAS